MTEAWPGYGMPPGYPTRDEVRAYIRVPATSIPDDELDRFMATAAIDQTHRCNTEKGRDPDSGAVADPLAQGFMRRVQREVAAKNLPLGMVGVDSTEYGPTRIQLDALILDHEKAYRIQVLG